MASKFKEYEVWKRGGARKTVSASSLVHAIKYAFHDSSPVLCKKTEDWTYQVSAADGTGRTKFYCETAAYKEGRKVYVNEKRKALCDAFAAGKRVTIRTDRGAIIDLDSVGMHHFMACDPRNFRNPGPQMYFYTSIQSAEAEGKEIIP